MGEWPWEGDFLEIESGSELGSIISVPVCAVFSLARGSPRPGKPRFVPKPGLVLAWELQKVSYRSGLFVGTAGLSLVDRPNWGVSGGSQPGDWV